MKIKIQNRISLILTIIAFTNIALSSDSSDSQHDLLSSLPNDIIQKIASQVDLSSQQALSNANTQLRSTNMDNFVLYKSNSILMNTTCGIDLTKGMHPTIGIFQSTDPSNIDFDLLTESCLVSIPNSIVLFNTKSISLTETLNPLKIIALGKLLRHSSITHLILKKELEIDSILDSLIDSIDDTSNTLQTTINNSKITHMSLIGNFSNDSCYPFIKTLSILPEQTLSSILPAFPNIDRFESGIQNTKMHLIASTYTSETLPSILNQNTKEIYLTLQRNANQSLLYTFLANSSITKMYLNIDATPIHPITFLKSRSFKEIHLKFTYIPTKLDLEVWSRSLSKRTRNVRVLSITQFQDHSPHHIPLTFLKTTRNLYKLSLQTELSLRREGKAFQDPNLKHLLLYLQKSNLHTLELTVTFHNRATEIEFVKFVREIGRVFDGYAFNLKTTFKVDGALFYHELGNAFREFKGVIINGLRVEVFLEGLYMFSKTSRNATFSLSF